MTDLFLVGLIAGGAVGFAGLAQRLLQVAALAAVGALAWVLATGGVAGLQDALAAVPVLLGPHLRLVAGALVGAILGASLARLAWARGG